MTMKTCQDLEKVWSALGAVLDFEEDTARDHAIMRAVRVAVAATETITDPEHFWPAFTTAFNRSYCETPVAG